MPNNINIFSFFSGAGFLDLGFEKNGYEITFVNEIMPEFMSAYTYSRRFMKLHEPKFGYSIEDINLFLDEKEDELSEYISKTKKICKFVGFIGGPPCPDFSVGGKNKGKEGKNGQLSLTYIQLIEKMQPDFFLFENVKGLWKTKRHREFFEELKSKLHTANYATTERLTNSLEFGAPQDRDRILLFGIRKDHLQNDNNKILNFDWTSEVVYDLDKIKKTNWPTKDLFRENSVIEAPADIIKELTVEYWFQKNDVESHPNSKDYFKPRNGLAKMKVIDEGDTDKKSYKRLHRWRYSPTVAYGNNEVHLHPYKARRLSVSEAMALQSLPSDFLLPEEMTLSAKFKTIGNGVPFLLADGIAKTIKKYLDKL